jgi:hypothetical protein
MRGTRRKFRLLSLAAFIGLSGCGTWIRYEDISEGVLQGDVLVEWIKEDGFIYRKGKNPLSFRPSFWPIGAKPISPDEMYTTGGSIPRVFWSIPGLSPWGLGPAYIIHDWIFEVHRCPRAAPPEVKQITFEQSATILAEVGKALIEAKLIEHNMLEEIAWGVSTRYARDIWDRPGSGDECRVPKARAFTRGTTVVNFTIPAPRR